MRFDGIFFSGNARVVILSVAGEPLKNVVKDLHVTFAFNPSPDNEIPAEYLGKDVTVTLVGLGNDGQNHGLLVDLSKILLPGGILLQKIYHGAQQPHITVSLADGAKAVKTGFIRFQPIPNPTPVTGVLGYWEAGTVHTSPSP